MTTDKIEHSASEASTTGANQAALDERAVTEAFRRPPDRRIDVGHSRLAYRRFGQGPDVVLVHGWPLHGATWRRIIPRLADSFTLHVVDMPGTGQTEWDDGAPIDILSHAAALRRATDELGLRRFGLVAHDSGGAVARYAAAGDERVAGVVLGNTEIPGYEPPLLRLICGVMRLPGGAQAFVSMMRSSRIRQSKLGFEGCFTDPRYVEGEFFDLFLRPLLASRRAADGQCEFARRLDFSVLERLGDQHRKITAPVLLVWGGRDPWFPIDRARAMVPQFPEAELVELPRAKLFAHEDHAIEFASHTRRLLTRALA